MLFAFPLGVFVLDFGFVLGGSETRPYDLDPFAVLRALRVSAVKSLLKGKGMAQVICPKCKAEVSSLTISCPSCHTPLTPESPTFSALRERGPRGENTFFGNFFDLLADPRGTMEVILAGPENLYTWPMLFTVSLVEFLNEALKSHEAFLSLLWIPLGLGIGWLATWVMAWLQYHVGQWLDGKGTFPELFDMVIWAGPLTCVSSLVSFCALIDASGAWHLIWSVIQVAVGIWVFIYALILLSTAHRFSMWRAFFTMLITVLIVVVPLGLLAWLISGLSTI